MLADRIRIGANGEGESYPIMIEDFEDDNYMDNYQIFETNTSYEVSEIFLRSTDIVYSGNYSSKVRMTGSGKNHMYSFSGLPYYPKQGDIFSIQARGSGAGLVFGVQDWSTKHRYYNFFFYDGSIKLYKYEGSIANDAEIVLATKNIGNTLTDTWYELKVEWHYDGTIRCTLTHPTVGVETISVVDTNYTEGGIGIGSDENKAQWSEEQFIYFDELKLIGEV